MLRVSSVLAVLFCLGVACVPSPPPPVVVMPTSRPISFLSDVKPVLDRRCVVCHSCYNAACQLKLDSFEGVERGGSKQEVYSPARLHAQQPTRLFLDAHSEQGWRALDFHSVIASSAASPANNALMLHLLEAKRLDPKPRGAYHAEAAGPSCPADPEEMGIFLAKYPERGMPFGFPAIEPGEHEILANWIARGAPGPNAEEQRALETPTPADAKEIAKWEAFLNREDAKHAMTARYLYEHFFLAHIRFAETGSGDFYEFVRSASPPGQPIDVIATVRPYDDPGTPSFYYRFRKIHSTIVHKTHMVVDFRDDTLARYRDLFIARSWLETPHTMPYDSELAVNPFVIYAQIPPLSRYEFLLDHSEYVIRTFIRGPVCKGQVALNVIHDHFWVFFQDPDSDLAVHDPDFLIAQAENLRLPNEEGSNEGITRTFSDEYRERYAAFYKAKSDLYDRLAPEGQGIEAIWPGRRPEDGPMLTVYRHFDSASVHKGALGRLPRTVWVIDYAQFERIYYALVAGFDVFGNLAHQVSVRRYMDYLRMEGELNFVHYLPSAIRTDTFQSWYVGTRAIEHTQGREIIARRGTRVDYTTDDPKREFVERLIEERLLDSAGIEIDPVNYRRAGERVPMPETFDSHEKVINGLRSLSGPGAQLVQHLHGYEVNVLWVRVRGFEGRDRHLSIVINRWHDNVNSLFFEKEQLDPAKDTMDFFPGLISSYPSYFLDVHARDVPEFLDMLQNFDGSPGYTAKLREYGVSRSDERFWELYDWFQARAYEEDPVMAGLFDLNRYHSHSSDLD